jgi:hypothetical protein
MKMNKKGFKSPKDKLYNEKRKPILRVEATAADTAEEKAEMDQMKIELVNMSGSAKQGVIDIYRFAKENRYFDKKHI